MQSKRQAYRSMIKGESLTRSERQKLLTRFSAKQLAKQKKKQAQVNPGTPVNVTV